MIVIIIEFCVLQNECQTCFTKKFNIYFLFIAKCPQSCDPIRTQCLKKVGTRCLPKKYCSSLKVIHLFFLENNGNTILVQNWKIMQLCRLVKERGMKLAKLSKWLNKSSSIISEMLFSSISLTSFMTKMCGVVPQVPNPEVGNYSQ